MSNPDIYQITLTPVGRFFFGGEVVFGGGENAQDQRRQSYLVHSNLLPQQTSLLGMLREELLRRNGLLKPWHDDADRTAVQKKREALELIGNTGFSVYQNKLPAKDKLPAFGIIEQISPLVIFHQSEGGALELQPAPMDDGPFFDKPKTGYSWRGGTEASKAPLLLEHYDPKSELSLHFSPEDDKATPRPLTDLFQQQKQVGITVTNRHKWRPGSDDTEGFFRHSSYRNRSTIYPSKRKKTPTSETNAFRFWVQLGSIPTDMKLWKDGLVQLGGERSTFRMEVKKMEDDYVWPDTGHFTVPYRHNKQAPAGYTRLLLLSDTYLSPEDLQKNDVFAVAGTVSFRFFSTTLEDTENFYAFKREVKEAGADRTFHFQKKYQRAGQGRRQSRRYTLLERGGVLLVPNSKASAIETAIESRTDFRQIGYNYYQTLKSS